jgi:hypothetical protein
MCFGTPKEASLTLKEYFQNSTGTGILSTADSAGAVNAAVYSKPHILDDGTIAFVMLERLTHHNLQSNPFAAYLFLENGPGHQGIRLHLKKVRMDADPAAVEPFLRRQLTPEEEERTGTRHLAVFAVVKILPLSGRRPPKADRVL